MLAWISRRVLAHEHVGCLSTQSMSALVLWAGNPYRGKSFVLVRGGLAAWRQRLTVGLGDE